MIQAMRLSGASVLPLVEGGKGIAISNGLTAGSWARAGGVGTFSGVNADWINFNGERVPLIYRGKTRRERHEELIAYSIEGGISQARIAHETAAGGGRIHMNVLWEMAAVERVLEGVLSRARDLIHGLTCGAGMPYRLGDFAARYEVYYYPIVSSARAFRALWKRAYYKTREWLGGVVYEDPWRAGGHNGLSNSEDPEVPQDPYPRVLELRTLLREIGLADTPIVMAGGVWNLPEWEEWIDNAELGPIAFQFGTRPLLTKESPISPEWKHKLLTLKPGDVHLNPFSPTGFYSSAVHNEFLSNLYARSERQVRYSSQPEGEWTEALPLPPRGRLVFLALADHLRATHWIAQGFTEALRTPDGTLVFVHPEEAAEIHQDQVNCMGCLSACKFSNWAQGEEGSTGKKADPRSFCIQKTLQDISHEGPIDQNLMFSGHGAYRFGTDPFYANGFIPTVEQLVERIRIGG